MKSKCSRGPFDLFDLSLFASYLAYFAAAVMLVVGLVLGGLLQGDCAARAACRLSPFVTVSAWWAGAAALVVVAHFVRKQGQRRRGAAH